MQTFAQTYSILCLLSNKNQHVLQQHEAAVMVADWSSDRARLFWTVFANYQAAPEVEGLTIQPMPRVLNSPGSALVELRSNVSIPCRASNLTAGVELGFVVRPLLTG
jgi:hypothetical protein